MADDEELMSGEEEEEIEPEMPQEEVWANILLASKKNDLELLTEMLEKWKDDFTVVQMAEEEWPPLVCAANKGYGEVVDMLIARGFGAQYKTVGDPGAAKPKVINSPIHWAAYQGFEHILCALMENSVSLLDKDTCGNNALHLASTSGHMELVKCILACGTDIQVRNLYGNTALGMATDPPTRTLLLQASNQPACDHTNEEFTPLTWRYLCSCCEQFFHGKCTTRRGIARDVGSSTMRPIRTCFTCEKSIVDKEDTLREAVQNSSAPADLEGLQASVKVVEAIPGACFDPNLVHKGKHLLSQLKATFKMNDEMEAVNSQRPLADARGSKALSDAIGNGVKCDVSPELIDSAQRLVRQSLSEVKLQRAVEPLKDVTCGADEHAKEISKLFDSLENIRAEGAESTDVAQISNRMYSRLTNEVDVGHQLKALGRRQGVKDEEAEVKRLEMERIDALKGGKKKKALKALKAEEALITSDMVGVDLEELKGLLTVLSGALENAGTLESNAELVTDAETVKKTLQTEAKDVEAVFETKKAEEEKIAAKKAKKKKNKA
jgi:hypothetical protein